MPECSITLRNVDIDFTIYGVHARSMKNLVLRATTGGVISFPNTSKVVVSALNNISIDVKSGERVGLIGHNGAGKTTLLRVLAGVYEPVRGSMKRIGKTSSLFDLSYGFDPNSTGLENILIRGMYLGLDRATLLKLREGIAEFSEARRLCSHSGPYLLRRDADAACLRNFDVCFSRYSIDGRMVGCRRRQFSKEGGAEAARADRGK